MTVIHKIFTAIMCCSLANGQGLRASKTHFNNETLASAGKPRSMCLHAIHWLPNLIGRLSAFSSSRFAILGPLGRLVELLPYFD